MNHLRIFLTTAIVGLAGLTVLAQSNSSTGNAPAAPATERKVGEPTPLVFWNRRIVILRAYYEKFSPGERAARAAERLAALPEAAPGWDVSAIETSGGQFAGVLITVNSQFVFSLVPEDVDPESG